MRLAGRLTGRLAGQPAGGPVRTAPQAPQAPSTGGRRCRRSREHRHSAQHSAARMKEERKKEEGQSTVMHSDAQSRAAVHTAYVQWYSSTKEEAQDLLADTVHRTGRRKHSTAPQVM